MDDEPGNVKIRLREERSDIAKKWVQTGTITCHREVITEEQNIIIPIKREELVIEKEFIDAASPNQAIYTETIRIPIKEERLEVKKQTFDLENVDLYKTQINKLEPVSTSLKKEVLHLDTTGNVILETIDKSR